MQGLTHPRQHYLSYMSNTREIFFIMVFVPLDPAIPEVFPMGLQ